MDITNAASRHFVPPPFLGAISAKLFRPSVEMNFEITDFPEKVLFVSRGINALFVVYISLVR